MSFREALNLLTHHEDEKSNNDLPSDAPPKDDEAPNTTRTSHLLPPLVVDDLPFDARMALDQGWISETAARHLLRLNIYNRLATVRPFARFEAPDADLDRPGSHRSWAERMAKLILWRPHYCFCNPEKIPFEVDSALYDLQVLATNYAILPEAEAAKLAEENLRDQDLKDGLCCPEYWWANLWVNMKPDFGRLSEDDREMIDEAAERYIGTPVTAESE